MHRLPARLSTNNEHMKPIIEEIRDGMAGHAAGLGERVRSNEWDMSECMGLEPIEGESARELGLRIITAARNGVVPMMDNTDIEFDAAYYAGMESVLESLEHRRDKLLAAATSSEAVLDETNKCNDDDSDYGTEAASGDAERLLRERGKVLPEGYCNDSSEITTAYAAMLAVLGFPKPNK